MCSVHTKAIDGPPRTLVRRTTVLGHPVIDISLTDTTDAQRNILIDVFLQYVEGRKCVVYIRSQIDGPLRT